MLPELTRTPAQPASTAAETYLGWTWMQAPDPFRAAPSTVAEFLRRTFPGPRLALGHAEHEALPTHLAGLGVTGRAVYDALTALTARAAGAELVTLDGRALGTYQRCGAPTRLLSGGIPASRTEV